MKTFTHEEVKEILKYIDLSKKMQFLDPSSAFVILLNNLNRRPSTAVTFSWLEECPGGTVREYNYCQRFKKTIQMFGDPNTWIEDRAYQRKKKSKEVIKDIDRAFLYGCRSNNGSITSGGLEYFCPHKIIPHLPDSLEEIEDFVLTLPNKVINQPSPPFAFMSPRNYCELIRMVRREEFPTTNTYGASIFQYITREINGESKAINFVKDIMVLDNRMYIAHLDYLVYIYKTDEDLRIIVDDDYDPIQDRIEATVGLEVHDVGRHLVVVISE